MAEQVWKAAQEEDQSVGLLSYHDIYVLGFLFILFFNPQFSRFYTYLRVKMAKSSVYVQYF